MSRCTVGSSLLVAALFSLLSCPPSLSESPHIASDAVVATGSKGELKYPSGPYGLQVGAVIENLTFQGKRDANRDGSLVNEQLGPIELADYYRHGQTKTRVLLLTACAAWCGPCNAEAPQLVTMYNNYATSAPGSVEFLDALTEKVNHQPPDEQSLNSWANKFHVPYAMATDPSGVKLLRYSTEKAYPLHIVVRTKDMTIAKIVVGAYIDDVRAAIDGVLAKGGRGDSD